VARLRIALAQVNLLVGDIEGNARKLASLANDARDSLQADVVAFPELSLTSYPPEDLLLRPELHRRVEQALDELRGAAFGIDIIVGHPHQEGGRLYNAASVLRDGAILTTYHKHGLPNYGVFDEKRYFVPGNAPCVVRIKGVPVGLTICEDMWELSAGAIDRSVAAGAKLILNINGSPFHRNKTQERLELAAHHARTHNVPLIYLNLVGGQDELVFDGESFVLNSAGELARRAPAFVEGLYPVEFETLPELQPVAGDVAPALEEPESVYEALVLGVRDYVVKNRFAGAVLGLSGGIDSALTLCIAVDALGADKVEAVMMPSRFTSQMSIDDARAQATALGVVHRVIPIEPMYQAFLDGLRDEFKNAPTDTTEENIQARVRGVTLMALSNKTGKMVLTTGNKSEMAVGYATLYGDMAGGFAAIKDVPKTLVYRLAEMRNVREPVIPRRVFERPPTAELAPNQKDSDSLPPYETLDSILERYVERDESLEDIIAAGFDAATVRRVIAMVDRNEYKRRQAPPGVRITPRAFGRDRRYPITSGYGRSQR
jgi:NAD+ synthase (glutamine-hydrolysing)